MKKFKKGVSALIAFIIILSMNGAYAADYSLKVAGGGLLRDDGNYYYTTKAYPKNVVFANDNFIIKNDAKLYLNLGPNDKDAAILENVAMVSEAIYSSNYFYYLDTAGNLFLCSSNPYKYGQLETEIVKENIGELSQLTYGFALTKKGELYQLKGQSYSDKETKLIDTNVKSYQPYKKVIHSDNAFDSDWERDELLYLKNENSLYSLNADGVVRRLLDNVSSYEVWGYQLRAKTIDGSWYEWGDNSGCRVVKMVDGINIAPKYIDTPEKITDNILYETDSFQLRIDGEFYSKEHINGSSYKYTLRETNVAAVREYGYGYLCQKFNGDIYSISHFWDSVLLCADVVKGFDKAVSEGYLQKTDGTFVVIDNDGKVVRSIISPTKYFGSSSWAQAELQEADKLGLLDSFMDYDFYYSISRKDFCVMIVDMCEAYTGKAMIVASANPFTDIDYDSVKNEREAILKAYAAGIVGGTSADKFSPADNIDRQQMAAMMYRASKYLKPGIEFGTPISFSDSGKFSSWAVEGINAMSSLGIIKGSDGNLDPKSATTIEQAGIMVLRLFKKL